MEINGFKIEKENQYNLDLSKKTSTCPECSASRKKKSDKCLSIWADKGIANCNHCGATLQLHTYKKRETVKEYKKPPVWKNKTELSEGTVRFFESRKISQDILNRAKITSGLEWMPQEKKEVGTIQFNYFVDGELINVKYRTKDKGFKLFGGAELVFYNLDAIKHETEVYIVEGEMDCLSLMQIGKNNVISVPNGAGSTNLSYLDNCIDYFENKEKIYLLVDNDEPGKKLEHELKRRLGVERCFYFDLNGSKDANEFHIKHGGENLSLVLDKPIAYPITDIVTMADDGDDLDNFLLNGMPKGYGIGLDTFDDVFTVETGRYMVFTGIPGNGKSTVLDHFMTSYNLQYGWKVAVASPENMPVFLHKERIITKFLGYSPKGKRNVNSYAYKQIKQYVDENFFFISFATGSFDLIKVLEKTKELIKRKGVKALVLDPYNKVKLKESLHKKVNDYTSDYLLELDTFSRIHDIFIALVAHTVKMQKNLDGTFEMPTFYDVKGGGEFYDMSPFGLGIAIDKMSGIIRIKVLKCKFAHLGQNGAEIEFSYNINNGRISKFDSFGQPVYDNSNWLASKEVQTKFGIIEDLPDDFGGSEFESETNPPF